MFLTKENSIIVYILLVVIMLAFFCAFIIFIVYKYQQKQQAYYKTIEDINATHKNILLQTQIEIQENTFNNIAKEMHDNIGQKLTLSKLYLNTINITDSKAAAETVNNTINLLTDTITTLSDISRSMSSELLEQNGLIRVIQTEINNLIRTGLYTVAFNVGGNEFFLDSNRETILFRIIQEAITNIIKHSMAKVIELSLQYTTPYLLIDIKDDGIGIFEENLNKGNGLLNIKKRVQLLTGNFEIIPTEKGTHLSIKIHQYATNH